MKIFSKFALLAFALVFLVSCSKDDELSSLDANSQQDEISAQFKAKPKPSKQADLPCGTPDSNFPMPLSMTEISNLANSFSPLPPIDVEIQYHIVRTTAGTDGIPLSELTTITNNINANFDVVLYGILNFVIAPDRLNFINAGYDYIDNSTYHMATSSQFGALTAINSDPDRINIYIVKELTNSGGNQIGGLGATPGNALITNRFNNTYLGSSPAHEVGHNLGMRHTHQSSASLCLNNNYSTTTGDDIYDTPLDLSLSGQVSSSCGYTGSQMTICGEALGPGVSDPHDVLIPNTMSYSRHACRIGFSGMQHLQMNAQALNGGLGELDVLDQ